MDERTLVVKREQKGEKNVCESCESEKTSNELKFSCPRGRPLVDVKSDSGRHCKTEDGVCNKSERFQWYQNTTELKRDGDYGGED